MKQNRRKGLMILAVVLVVAAIGAGAIFTRQHNKKAASQNDLTYAQELYAAHNPYIGDNSADGALLDALEISKEFGAYTFELKTDEEPYSLRIFFTDQVADAAGLESTMRKDAVLLLALIDNASEIQWQYTGADKADGAVGELAGSLTVKDADALLNADVKSYGQSADHVQYLLDWLDNYNWTADENPTQSASADAVNTAGVDRTDLDACVSAAILQANADQYPDSDFQTESHVVLKTVESGDTTTVYAMALYLQFTYADGALTETGGSHMPVAITFDKNANGEYDLKEYWMPRDGTEYAPSIKAKFPADIYENGLDTQKYIQAEAQDCYAKVIAHDRVDTAPILANYVETICSSPVKASDPKAYTEAHPYEYRQLLYYGDATLRYAYGEFLKGGQTGLQGQILLSAMRELLGSEDVPAIMAGTAQDWFDQWKAQAVNLRDANSPAFMQEKYPKTAIMLQMLEKE